MLADNLKRVVFNTLGTTFFPEILSVFYLISAVLALYRNAELIRYIRSVYVGCTSGSSGQLDKWDERSLAQNNMTVQLTRVKLVACENLLTLVNIYTFPMSS